MMNIDDDSDLTSIESGDEYVPGPTASLSAVTNGNGSGSGSGAKGGRGGGDGGYMIRNTLKPPRATTYSAKALFEAIGNGDISLEAEYQRDVVWQDTKQIGLIDSIFRNFYVPPIIFATKTWEDGSETKICIDGKQRLTSIRRFMEGCIPHKDPITSEKWYYIDNTAISATRNRKKILPVKLQRIFENKQVVCVEYQDITDSDEREIFQRVQLGMALTPAEKLQVIATKRAALTRSLVQRYITNGPLNPDSLDWDATRGSDFRCVASALWCLARWDFSASEDNARGTKKKGVEKSTRAGGLKTVPSVMQLEKWLSGEGEVEEGFRARVEDAFRIFGEVVGDRKLGRRALTSAGPEGDSTGAKEGKDVPVKVSPLEFVFSAVLVGVWKDRMGKEELAGCIGGMRRNVREKHVDVRLNSKVGKTMIEFIRSLKPGSAYGAEDSDEDTEEDSDVDEKKSVKGKGKAGTKAKGGKKGGKKRKRDGESDEDMDIDSDEDAESDWDYGVPASKKKKVKPTPSKKPSSSASVLVPPVPPTPSLPSSKPSSSSARASTSNAGTPSLPSRKSTLEQQQPTQQPASSSRMAALRVRSAPQRSGLGSGAGMPPPLPSSSSPRIAPALPSFKKTSSSIPTSIPTPPSTASGGCGSGSGPGTPAPSGNPNPNANPYTLQAATFNAVVQPYSLSSAASSASTSAGGTPVPVLIPGAGGASWEHSAYQAHLQAAVHGLVVPSLTPSYETPTSVYPGTGSVYAYSASAPPPPAVPSLPSRPSTETIALAGGSSGSASGGRGRSASGGSPRVDRSGGFPRLDRVGSPKQDRFGGRDGGQGNANANNAPLKGNRWPALARDGGGSGTYRDYASGSGSGEQGGGWERDGGRDGGKERGRRDSGRQ